MPPYASGYSKKSSLIKRKKPYASAKAKMFKSIVGAERKGPELKSVDVNDVGGSPVITLVSTTFTLNLLNGLATGTNHYNRIGKSVCMKSLLVTGALFPSGQAGTAAGEFLRVAIIYDRQVNGAIPAYADIYQCIDQGGNTSSTSFDMPNIDNSERFIVLADEQWAFPNTAITNGATDGFVFENILDQTQKTSISRYIKLKDLPCNYIGTGGTIAGVASGALYLITLGSQAAASAGCTFNWTSRLRYTDA